MHAKFLKALFLIVAASLMAACTSTRPAGTPNANSNQAAQPLIKLTLAAFSTPSEAYGKIIPLFVAQWKAQNNQDVKIEQTYGGSGAQSRAVVGGLEADVVALSLEGDVSSIAKANLITRDWQAGAPNKGIVSTSIVAFAVRKGNPKNIHDWADLAQPGLQILTPDPKTSGGAQWNILALYGAALRGKVTGIPSGNEAAATAFLVSVLRNVTALDKDARGSITNFETGNGDVAITYENEVLLGQQRKQDYELVIPVSTILIENPVAVVDGYSDKHGTTSVADAFVKFLFTKEAQQIFAQYGFRPTDSAVAAANVNQFPKVKDLFTIGDVFGGWPKAKAKYFSDTGIYNQAIAKSQGK
jgi:sulfate transport system substrate-binding protein